MEPVNGERKELRKGTDGVQEDKEDRLQDEEQVFFHGNVQDFGHNRVDRVRPC
jgi:hypothetical protein